jgi:anti-anti-sigma factor
LVVTEDHFAAIVELDGDATVIHVKGEIDIATCARLRDVIEPHLGPAQSIVLDLSQVAFMDSSCLSVLVQAKGRLTADGGSLVLRNPSDAARRVLTVARAQGLIDVDTEARHADPA